MSINILKIKVIFKVFEYIKSALGENESEVHL